MMPRTTRQKMGTTTMTTRRMARKAQIENEDEVARGWTRSLSAHKTAVARAIHEPNICMQYLPHHFILFSFFSFQMTQEYGLSADCGPSYRHQLNHNPKQIYKCDFPECDRQFVRLDLCNRHKERHTAKGSTLSRRDSLIGHLSPATDGRHGFPPPGSLSPEANRPGSAYSRPPMHPHFQDVTGSPYTPVTNTTPVFPHPNGVNYMRPDGPYGHISGQQPQHQSPHGPQRPSVQTNVTPYGVLSPASQHGFQGPPNGTPQSATPYSGQGNFPPFSLPPSNFQPTAPSANVPREGGQGYGQQHGGMNEQFQGQPQPTGEMVLLDNMSTQTTIPVFGSDSVLNKSPYVGMPEDFMAYLFNTQGGESAPMNSMMPNYNK